MSDLRTTVLSSLAALALKKAALKETTAPFETQIAAIQKALRDATAADLGEIERLEEHIKLTAAENAAVVFGSDSTLKAHGHRLSKKQAEKVELIDSEDQILSDLVKLSDSKDAAQRLAANACLVVKRSLNKTFVHQNYDTNPEWFEALGITVTEYTTTSLTEVKPPRAKVTVEAPKAKDDVSPEA